MRRSLLFTPTSVGLGMGLMYFFDPQRGRRRRRWAQDRAAHLRNQASRSVTQAIKNVSDRSQGTWSKIKANLSSTSQYPSDPVLEARVRSKIGRVSSHPHALKVSAQDGRVTLQGSILQSEVDPVIHAIQNVPGVQQIQPLIQSFPHSEGIPELQGGKPLSPFITRRPSSILQLMTGIAGVGSITLSLLSRNQARAIRIPLFAGGAALVMRSLFPSLFQGFSSWDRKKGFSLHQTIHLNVPLEQTFAFLSRVENFTQFMTHLQEVRSLGDGQSYWRIQGPLRLPLSWVSEVYELHPLQSFAWRSFSDAHLQNSGRMRFFRTQTGGTQVELQFHYNPPLGRLGYVLSRLLGFNPHHWIQQSLVQLKQVLEKEYLPGPIPQIQKTAS